MDSVETGVNTPVREVVDVAILALAPFDLIKVPKGNKVEIRSAFVTNIETIQVSEILAQILRKDHTVALFKCRDLGGACSSRVGKPELLPVPFQFREK